MSDSATTAGVRTTIGRRGAARSSIGAVHRDRSTAGGAVRGLPGHVIGPWLAVGVLLWTATGCALWPMAGSAAPGANPMYVAAADRELVWERVVDTLHDFKFQIVRENRLNGTIETDYKVGAGVLEPWHPDSVRPVDRWESTFQSIRRRVRVRVMPAEGASGFFVSVEALKESEVGAPGGGNSPGPATFTENQPLARDLNAVVGEAAPEGWMTLGRDTALEQAILARLAAKL